MIEPPPAGFIGSTTVCMPSNAPVTLTRNILARSSAVSSAMGRLQ